MCDHDVEPICTCVEKSSQDFSARLSEKYRSYRTYGHLEKTGKLIKPSKISCFKKWTCILKQLVTIGS